MENNNFPRVEVEVVGRETIDLNTPPNFVRSIEHTIRTNGAGNIVSLELFDPTWGILDVFFRAAAEAARGELLLKFRYGYHNDMSPQFQCAVTRSVPGKYTQAGVEFTLEATDIGVINAYKTEEDPKRIYTGKISEIVAAIAQQHGWETDIQETDTVHEYTGNGGAVQRKWVKGDMSDLEFIRYLVGFAYSSKVVGRYDARLVTDSQGVSTLVFKPPENRKLYKTYNLIYAQTEEVIEFEPQLENLTTTAYGGGGLEVVGRDVATRAKRKTKTDSLKTQNVMFLGSRAVIPPGYSTRISAHGDEKRLDATVNAYYAYLANFVQKATLTVHGDHRVRVNDLVGVIVITPQGRRYFTSGTWRVNNIINRVSGGSFQTELALTRNAVDVGHLAPEGPKLPGKIAT